MKVLYIGDIMAEPGHKVVQEVLPDIKKQYKPDFVIAQAENSDPNGKGPGKAEIESLQSLGIDFFTGGNHSLTGQGSAELYGDPKVPITRPANLPDGPGHGYKIINSRFGSILVISVLGQTVGKPLKVTNPLTAVDKILTETKNENLAAIIVNFHGDFSSEKRVIGYYLDGRVSAVIGDHWHVPTADAMILPGGTAHITDVGMCGTVHSSLGVSTSVIVDRWKTSKASKNQIEHQGPLQFNAVVIDIDEVSGSARSIEHIQRVVEE